MKVSRIFGRLGSSALSLVFGCFILSVFVVPLTPDNVKTFAITCLVIGAIFSIVGGVAKAVEEA